MSKKVLHKKSNSDYVVLMQNLIDVIREELIQIGYRTVLKPGDLLVPRYSSNYGERKKANYVYLTATLDAATWGAELEVGDESGRIYRVEPTGPIENDPNLTDKKFPGNPTRSYRTQHPLRVVCEILDWERHSPEKLQKMLDHLDELKRLGIEAINE